MWILKFEILQIYLMKVSWELTGLAQSRVVRLTPINGVTEIIFEVNLGKNSLDKTATKKKTLESYDSMWRFLRLHDNRSATNNKLITHKNNNHLLPPTIVGTNTTWKVLIARPCKDFWKKKIPLAES